MVVGVDDARVRMENLRKACLDERTAEKLILGVRNVLERNLLPRPARDAPVYTRKESESAGISAVRRDRFGGTVEPLYVDQPAPASPCCEVSLHLALHHVTGVGSRHVRPENCRDVIGDVKPIEERCKPTAVRRRCV